MTKIQDFIWCSLCRRIIISYSINTLRMRQSDRHFPDIFRRIFVNENIQISIDIPLNVVPYGPIDYDTALVQIMAWRWAGDKPLSEAMKPCSLTNIMNLSASIFKCEINFLSLYRVKPVDFQYQEMIWTANTRKCFSKFSRHKIRLINCVVFFSHLALSCLSSETWKPWKSLVDV